MPKDESMDMLQDLFAASTEERIDLAELRQPLGPEPALWTPRLTPILTLLQEVLADLFEVRDHVLQVQTNGRKPSRAVLRQYERDLQWVSTPGEHAPFSFGWVCVALGLEASAVRRRYLSGQPATVKRRRTVRHAYAPERLLRAG